LPRLKLALAKARTKSLPEMAGLFFGHIKGRAKAQPFIRGFTPLEIMHCCSVAGVNFRIIPLGFNASRWNFLTGFTFGGLEIKFKARKWIIEEGGDHMREEGLLYDPQRRGFLHVNRDNGRLIIDSEPCRHEHTQMVVFAA
jgi:hypothetical protein